MSDTTTTPATNWSENITAEEASRFEAHAEFLRDLQRRNAPSGKAHRALHAKPNLGLRAELRVAADLPAYARVGVFAQPRTFHAYLRCSNGGSAPASDAKPDVRGLAIKLLGVDGKKIIPGMENETTQDFLFIRSSVTPFRTADEFVGFVKAAQNPALLLPRLFGVFGPWRALGVVHRLIRDVSRPMVSIATTDYFTALPLRFGPHAARLTLTPHARADAKAKPGKAPSYLADELTARVQQAPLGWDLRAQFFVDERKTPIEDASVDWLESDAPYLTLASLIVPQQDPTSESGRRLAERIETFSFDPWHALEEFRPLGGMMRARNHAYRLSTKERGAAAEPRGSSELGEG